MSEVSSQRKPTTCRRSLVCWWYAVGVVVLRSCCSLLFLCGRSYLLPRSLVRYFRCPCCIPCKSLTTRIGMGDRPWRVANDDRRVIFLRPQLGRRGRPWCVLFSLPATVVRQMVALTRPRRCPRQCLPLRRVIEWCKVGGLRCNHGRGVMFRTETTLTPSQRQQLERHCCRRLVPSSIGIRRQQETFKIGSVLVNLTSSSERLRRLTITSTVPAAASFLS